MKDRVLVTYASRMGGTKGIAEKIAEELQGHSLQVDVIRVDRVKDLSPYQALVLGSGVYIGQWRREAAAFLKKNETALAQLPTWLFSSGPTGEGELDSLLQGWHFPAGLQAVADRIKPRDMIIFRGVVYEKDLNFIERWMMKNVGAAYGDYRDWERVTDWAGKIANELKQEKPITAETAAPPKQ